jgi:dTDP-L-rhamnose 4-epimerase
VRDVARANRLALTCGDAVPGPLNIASGRPHTVLQMASALVDALGPGAPRPVVTRAWRPGDVRHVVADPTRARERLGFVAETHLADGMREFATAPLRGQGVPARPVMHSGALPT